MSSTSPEPTWYVIFAGVAVLVLKAVNEAVTEPYMVRKSSHWEVTEPWAI